MLNVQSFTFNALEENTYVLYDETKQCIVIDPGCYDKSEEHELSDFIQSNALQVVLLLNTHCHVDHILGNHFIKEKYKTKLLIHPADKQTLTAAKVYAPYYGFHQFQDSVADGFIDDGDEVPFGNHSLKVLYVPGHAPGHVAFYNKENQILIGGDVLFYNSIGRTDLPGGNYETLINSIHSKLFTLPDDVTVYPGHGPATSIGFEKRTNPFCGLNSIR